MFCVGSRCSPIAFGALSTIAAPDLWEHLFLYHEWLGGVLMGFCRWRYRGTQRSEGSDRDPQRLDLDRSQAHAISVALARSRARFVGHAGAPAFTLPPRLWTAIALVVVGPVLTSGSSRALRWLPKRGSNSRHCAGTPAGGTDRSDGNATDSLWNRPMEIPRRDCPSQSS